MTGVSLLLIVVAVVLLGYGLLDGSNPFLVASILASLLAALTLVIGSRRGGRAAVVAAVEAEEAARGRRRARQDQLVGAGVRGGTGGTDIGGAGADGREFGDLIGPSSDEYTDRDDLGRGTHNTAMLDLGRRGVPAQSAAPVGDRDMERTDFDRDSDDEADSEYRSDTYGDARVALYDDDDDNDDFDDDDPADEPPAQRITPADAARVAQLEAEVLVIDGRPRYHLPGCLHLLGRDHESLPVGEAVELGFTPCALCEPDSALLARARRV